MELSTEQPLHYLGLIKIRKETRLKAASQPAAFPLAQAPSGQVRPSNDDPEYPIDLCFTWQILIVISTGILDTGKYVIQITQGRFE